MNEKQTAPAPAAATTGLFDRPRKPTMAAALESAAHSSSVPLDREVRDRMETLFQHDFSDVRVHHDDLATRAANALAARAFTAGTDIVFNRGRYSPRTREGSRLLAHELAHVVQQRGRLAGLQPSLKVGPRHTPAEREADAAADRVMANEFAGRLSSTEPLIARDELDAGAPPPITDGGALPGGLPDAGTSDSAAPDAQPQQQQQPAQPPQQQAPPAVQNEALLQPGLAWNAVTPAAQATGFHRFRNPAARGPWTSDTAGTYISHIQIQIHPNAHTEVTLTWANANLSPNDTLPTIFHASAGAGMCSFDCRTATSANSLSNNCTPLGNFTVQGFSPYLQSARSATAVTWIDYANAIAFHYYATPMYSASHGCVRLQASANAASWIHDNSIAGVTTVTIARDPGEGLANFCYEHHGASSPIERTTYDRRRKTPR